jgi:small subunit ribosomal protein S17
MIQKSIDERGKHKVQQGVVLSNKMDKTVVIGVTTKKAHPLYGKYVTRTRKFVAHDEKNECGVGDTVKIMETRPLSRTKRWRVINIVEKAVLTEDPTQLM